jgi:hypothetical protein
MTTPDPAPDEPGKDNDEPAEGDAPEDDADDADKPAA